MAPLPFTATPSPHCFHSKSNQRTKAINFTQARFLKQQENAQKHQLLQEAYFNRLSSLCKEGQLQESVDLFTEMDRKNIPIGPTIYGELLQGCLHERALITGKQIHAQIIKNGDFFARKEYIETKLLIFYARCDDFEIANRMFPRLRVQNVFSWAAIIGLLCRSGFNKESLDGFRAMMDSGFLPDNFVLPNALKACGALQWMGFGRGVHGYAVKMGFVVCVFVASSLIDMYGKCGILKDARKVFDGMPDRNVVAWNSMIVSYAQNGINEEAIEMFSDMRVEGVELSEVTLSSLLSASANLSAIEEGKQGHAIAVLGGFELGNILGSSILNFYSKVGLIEDAELVFSRMLEKDVVTWNLLISGYVQSEQIEKALKMCRNMRLENIRFDSVTLSSILSASALVRNIELGKQGHCYCIRNNLESDVVVASSIVNMYAKCERIDHARLVFNSTTKKDIILWNTLLAAYAEIGPSNEALWLFYQMQLDGVPTNVISWNAIILGFLRNGQVNEAIDMFSQMQSSGVHPNLITWTTLISGLAQNGYGEEAILTFQKMQESGLRPNSVSIISALSACTDLASLQHGRAIHSYVTRHDLWPAIPIATALVDMYAKCGNIDQAKRAFNTIPSKDLPVYNAMISGYALHGQAVEALAVFKYLQEEGLEPDSTTFTSVLSACSHGGLINEGLKFFVDMVSEYHFKPSKEHFGCVVNLLSRCGNLDEAFRVILTMPYEPDAPILGSLLAACREHQKIELSEYLSKHLLKLEPDNAGNYVALSNAHAAAGKWGEVSKLRYLMKEKNLKKNPGCSWVQIGGEQHVFVAGDGSHPKSEEIYATLALLGVEMKKRT